MCTQFGQLSWCANAIAMRTAADCSFSPQCLSCLPAGRRSVPFRSICCRSGRLIARAELLAAQRLNVLLCSALLCSRWQFAARPIRKIAILLRNRSTPQSHAFGAARRGHAAKSSIGPRPSPLLSPLIHAVSVISRISASLSLLFSAVSSPLLSGYLLSAPQLRSLSLFATLLYYTQLLLRMYSYVSPLLSGFQAEIGGGG